MSGRTPDWAGAGRRGKEQASAAASPAKRRQEAEASPPAPPPPEVVQAPPVPDAVPEALAEALSPAVPPPEVVQAPPRVPKRGDTVHYSLANGDAALGTTGDCRVAVVMDVLGDGRAKISVTEPQSTGPHATFRVTVAAGAPRQPGTWHWPEREG